MKANTIECVLKRFPWQNHDFSLLHTQFSHCIKYTIWTNAVQNGIDGILNAAPSKLHANAVSVSGRMKEISKHSQPNIDVRLSYFDKTLFQYINWFKHTHTHTNVHTKFRYESPGEPYYFTSPYIYVYTADINCQTVSEIITLIQQHIPNVRHTVCAFPL